MTRSREPLLLTLDYPGYRAEARMAELRLSESGLHTHELLHRPLPRETRGADYAARALARHPVPGSPDTLVGPPDAPVTAVAAYCASAPLAFEVAARVPVGAGDRQPPLLVLFDAEPGTREPVLESYREALRQFGVAPATPPDPGLLDQDPRAFADGLTAGVRSHALDALREFAADEEEAAASAEQFAATYADWSCHLIAAYHSRMSEWSGDVLHIVSAETTHPPFPHGARSVSQIRIGCSRKDLLRSAETRDVLLHALAQGGAPNR